jgi:hypothetical protein
MTDYQIISMVTSTLTPLAIVVLGYWFNKRLKHLDNAYQRQNEMDREEKEQKRAGEIGDRPRFSLATQRIAQSSDSHNR